MRRNRLKQFRKTMAEFSAIQAQQGSVPAPLLEWAEKYFSAMPDIQATIGKAQGDEVAAVEGIRQQMKTRGLIPRVLKVVNE